MASLAPLMYVRIFASDDGESHFGRLEERTQKRQATMTENRGTPRLRRVVLAIMLGFAADAAVLPASAAQHYVATPLGSLGGSYSWALAINNRGEMTGVAEASSGGARAFLYASGFMSAVGGPAAAKWSYGRGISDNGYVTGGALDADDWDRAFLDAEGTTIDLSTLGGRWSTGLDVNAAGHVVGISTTALDPNSRAFLYRNGVMINLDTLGGHYSVAQGINAIGQVTGVAGTVSGPGHAFLYFDGVMTDLGTLGGPISVGEAINARGEITGYADTSNPPPFPTNPLYGAEHAFFYAGGIMTDLGTLGGLYSHGRALNAAGHVVGESQTAEGLERAFVFSHGAMHDLNALVVSGLEGATLTDAYGINDNGQIAANSCGRNHPYDCKAFLLDPLTTQAAIEYYNAANGHYFVTSSAAEIAQLDAGLIIGWVRTGQTFQTYPVDTPGTANVCRFWSGQTFAPKSSHFYTSFDWECAIVKGNRGWQFEGEVFAMRAPDPVDGCAAGTASVYRLYNTGKNGAPNHRYTTSLAIRLEMVAQGWIPEGYGTFGVIGCVPVQ